jgi:hypothetical protein
MDLKGALGGDMKRLLIALALLGACGTSEEQPGNAAGAEEAAQDAVADAVRTASLTGLYEGGAAEQTNQLCIIDRGSGNARFGLVVWGENLHSCSGTGGAVREDGVLRLTMAGDETCAIEATIEDGIVTLPDTLPEGCAYYCGARAGLAGATFQRTGTSAQDAMTAVDLVGEPLCAGMSPAG